MGVGGGELVCAAVRSSSWNLDSIFFNPALTHVYMHVQLGSRHRLFFFFHMYPACIDRWH